MRNLVFFLAVTCLAQNTTRLQVWAREGFKRRIILDENGITTYSDYTSPAAPKFRVLIGAGGDPDTSGGYIETINAAGTQFVNRIADDGIQVFGDASSIRLLDDSSNEMTTITTLGATFRSNGGTIDRIALAGSAGTATISNSGGASRIFAASGGALSTTVGALTGYTGAAGVETFVWRNDLNGFSTTKSMRMYTSSVGNYAGWKVNPALVSDLEWQMPTADAAGCLVSNGSGVTSWTPCSAGDFVTIDTDQTITAANKYMEGVLTFRGPGSSVDRVVIGSGSTSWFNSFGANRITMSSGGGTSTTVGSITGSTGASGSEANAWQMNQNGMGIYGNSRFVGLYDNSSVLKVKLEAILGGVGLGPNFSMYNGTGGTTEMVTFQAGTGAGYFAIAKNASGTIGVYSTGETVGSGGIGFGSDPFSSLSSGWTYSGNGNIGSAGNFYGMPATQGTAGDCFKRTASGGQLQTEWGTCGSGGVSAVTGSTPIVSSGGSTPEISCPTCVTSNTAQDISGTKTWGSGAVIKMNNTFGALKGEWNEAQLRIGDTATGSGRGISLSTGALIQIFNTSSVVNASINDSGTYASQGNNGINLCA